MMDFDVAVAGGGPAGATTALLLARAGLRTALILGPPSPGAGIGESLAPAVNPLLHRLGLYDCFHATNPTPCYLNRSSWGGDGILIESDFLRDPHGPGWHIDRPAFDAMLVRAAAEAGAVLLPLRAGPHPAFGAPSPKTGGRLGRLGGSGFVPDIGEASGHSSPGTVGLPLPQNWGRGPGGEGLAPILIDATGRAAAVARRLGGRLVWADRMVAIVGFLAPAGAPMADTATLVEAVPEGWWYSAPLPDGRLVAAFHTDPALPAARAARDAAGWRAQLSASIHTRARVERHGFELAEPPRMVPAGTAILQPLTGAGWLAVGDAAVQHDPLGAHGIVSALHSAARAAGAVQAYRSGDFAAFDRYAAERRAAYLRFLDARAAYYRDVQRWPTAPFWRTRQRPTESTA